MSGMIGSDETLKGDTFGGIVVVGCYFDDDIPVYVTDSKKLAPHVITQTALNLLENYADRFAIISMLPEEYNTWNSQTQLLNELHNSVGKELKERFGKINHVVDKYPGCKAGDIAMEKAEVRVKAVAAASIIARYYGLLQIEDLSREAGFKLPLGSTHVEDALIRLVKEQKDLSKFAKLRFKNVAKHL